MRCPKEQPDVNYAAGIDVGTRTTRALILDEHGQEMGRLGRDTGARLDVAAEQTMQELCVRLGLGRHEIAYAASTGYGRYRALFRQIQITEMTCHAVGARYLFPQTRSVLDIGAMNSRAMRIADTGRRVEIHEGGTAGRLRVAVGHPDHDRFLQAQHVAGRRLHGERIYGSPRPIVSHGRAASTGEPETPCLVAPPCIASAMPSPSSDFEIGARLCLGSDVVVDLDLMEEVLRGGLAG